MQQRNINTEFKILIQRKFDHIVKAAMKKDVTILNHIKANAFPFPPSESRKPSTPFSLVVEGQTPLSRLAFEGEDEAVNFLIAEEVDYREACIGYLVSGNQEKCDAFFSKNNTSRDEILKCYVRSSWLSVNDENKETILQKDDYTLNPTDTNGQFQLKVICLSVTALALARRGVRLNVIDNQVKMKGISNIIGIFKGEFIENNCHYLGCVSEFDDNYVQDLFKLVNEDYESVFKGLLASGNLMLINALLKMSGSYGQGEIVECLVQQSMKLGYMHHPELIGYLQHAVDSPKFSAECRYIYKKIGTPIELFEKAAHVVTHLNARYHNLSLNHFQLESMRIPGTIIWILQGIQMVKNRQISTDIFIQILGFITDLPEKESIYLNDQIRFKYLRDFLADDIQKYTGGLKNKLRNFAENVWLICDSSYKKPQAHYDRAISFLSACEQTKSLPETRELLTNQYNLFSKKPLPKQASPKQENRELHDEPFNNDEKDGFTHAIERHYGRM